MGRIESLQREKEAAMDKLKKDLQEQKQVLNEKQILETEKEEALKTTEKSLQREKEAMNKLKNDLQAEKLHVEALNEQKQFLETEKATHLQRIESLQREKEA